MTTIPVSPRTSYNATTAELRLATAAGRTAYEAGRSAAPSLDATVRSLIGDGTAVGEHRTLQVMHAFSAGFSAAADEAAAAVLADMP